MGIPWEVESFDLGDGETSLDELGGALTPRQQAQLTRHLQRLEKHGRDLPPQFFAKVQGSQRLCELRLTVEGAELRLLYVQIGRTFYLLKGFRHQRDRDVQRHIKTAEIRLAEWGI
jgi:phage-related protein